MARTSLKRISSDECFPRGRVPFQLSSICKTSKDLDKFNFFVANICEQMNFDESSIEICVDDEFDYTAWFVVDSSDIECLKDAYRDSKEKYK